MEKTGQRRTPCIEEVMVCRSLLSRLGDRWLNLYLHVAEICVFKNLRIEMVLVFIPTPGFRPSNGQDWLEDGIKVHTFSWEKIGVCLLLLLLLILLPGIDGAFVVTKVLFTGKIQLKNDMERKEGWRNPLMMLDQNHTLNSHRDVGQFGGDSDSRGT
ncbi:hypothetical protein ECG_01982 [Echinococcus granulosus]|uniref:Transmembrane protein n=1 Tax=Echinococcus granulosus TaxID=6210 RepID=A0A068W759_ECHGR|nr:hypothetical protein ECG_01982 [Echinococcus granulosus]CDS14997.1 hypothetical protein EgrG_002012000 [Echinococcus granulosus]